MQIVEIPKEKGEYQKADNDRLDLVVAHDAVKVATLLTIHKENTLDSFLLKKGYIALNCI